MINTEISNLEQLMRIPVDIPLDLNDMRIIVECLRAVTYFGEIEGEVYLDSEGQALKDRIERLYLDMIECRSASEENPASRGFHPFHH